MPGDAALPPGQQQVPDPKVRHYGPIPSRPAERWVMAFGADAGDGLPATQLGQLSFPELAEFEQVSVQVGLHCASGWSALGLVWEGVRAAAVLDRFPPPPGTVGVLAYAEYGYSTNLRLSDLAEPTTLLATRLNGRPIPPEHGYPVRLVVPHLYGYKSPKWFRGWEYLARVRRGFWEERGYHLTGDPWQEQRYSYLE